jgi:hypothetical protein
MDRLALAGPGLGALRLEFGRADFVGGGVAGFFEGAPHVPGGDGAVRAPTFAEGQEFCRARHVFFVVGDGPAFLDAKVVDGEDIGAAEAEDQEHFDGPCADAADGNEAFDQFVVGEFQGLFVGGHDAVDGFLREVFHGQNFCAGEAGFPEGLRFELQHLLWSRRSSGCAERFDSGEDGCGGFAGDGLVGDGLQESFIRGLGVVYLGVERDDFLNEAGDAGVAVREVRNGGGEIEGELRSGGHGWNRLEQLRWKEKTESERMITQRRGAHGEEKN